MFGMGSTDIKDLITNTIGTCLGYVIYKLIRKFILKWDNKVKATNIKDYIEVLFFITLSVLIMITIQPWIMHTFFHLG
jgi:glycopeptide antibiotics resistance protein